MPNSNQKDQEQKWILTLMGDAHRLELIRTYFHDFRNVTILMNDGRAILGFPHTIDPNKVENILMTGKSRGLWSFKRIENTQ